MKVAIIRRSFRVDGGAETAVSRFRDAYISIGSDVTMICESWNDRNEDNVLVCEMSTKGTRIGRARQFEKGVLAYLSNNRFDHVQTHEWIPSVPIIRLGDGLHSEWFKVLSESKFMFARWAMRFSKFHEYKLSVESRTLSHPDLETVIVNSQFVGNQVIKAYPSLESRLKLIYNVVDSSFFSKSLAVCTPEQPRDINLLFIGSGWARKGLETAINVVHRFGSKMTLTVIGHDKRRQHYERMVKRLGLTEQISFKGVVPMRSADYRAYDGLILPSMYDPFPNVASEALVSGVPVFCSAATGVIDFARCEGVTLCESVSSYVSALRTEFSRPDRYFFEAMFCQERLESSLREIVC